MSTPMLHAYERLVRRQVLVRGGKSLHRTINGRLVHYYDIQGQGDGPPLLLLHGLGGSASSYVTVMFALRKKWSRIVIPDLPGHGLTPLNPGETPLTVRGHGELAYAFLQEVIHEPVVLVGHSMGGALVLGIAIEKSAEIEGLVLISPAGAPVTEADLMMLRQRFAPRSRREAYGFIRNLTHRPMPAAFIAAREVGERLRGRAVQHILAEMHPAERLDGQKMRELKMPVLLIWGESERILPEGSFDYLKANLPPQARIAIIERCGHMPTLEHPVQTMRLFDELADEVARRARMLRSAA